MDDLLISIVIPVYNTKDYLEQCVRSVLNQTAENLELILVDDGSTDESGMICDAFAKEDTRVRVIHQENGGVHTARNRGILEAKGQYLMFIDADDWIDEETIESIQKILQKETLDILRFSFVREYNRGSVKKINTFVKEGLSVGEDYKNIFRQAVGLTETELLHIENFNFLSTACTSVYRRAMLISGKVEFPSREALGSFEDGLFNIKAFACARSFYYIDKHYYHYRKTNADSCTVSYRENYLEKQGKLFEIIYKIAKKENPQFMSAYYNRIVFSAMELCMNATNSGKGRVKQFAEIKAVVNNPVQQEAFRKLQLRYLPLVWKIYFGFAKYRLPFLLFCATKTIQHLKRKR